MRAIRLARVSASAVLVASTLLPSQTATDAFSGRNGKIAFVSNRSGNWDIWVMNPDGTAQTNLTNDSRYDATATVSSDGARIAFQKVQTGGSLVGELFVMNTDGSGQTALTEIGHYDAWPDWQPR